MLRRTRPRANRTVAALFAAKQESLEGTQQVCTEDRDSPDEGRKEQSSVAGFVEATEEKEPTVGSCSIEPQKAQEVPDTVTTEPQQVAPSTLQPDSTSILPAPLNTTSQIDAPELPLPSTSSTPTPSAPPAAVVTTPKAAWSPSTSQDTGSSVLAFKSRRPKRPTVADRFASRESPPVSQGLAGSSQEQCSTSASSKDMACVGGANEAPCPVVRAPDGPNAVADDAETKSLSFDVETFSIGESLPSVPGIPNDGFGSESNNCDAIFGSGNNATQSTIDNSVDFDIWVETDINPAWCLEVGNGDSGQWRGACQTASLRRKWEEFEALGQQVIPGATDLSIKEALELLGLPDDADLAQVQQEQVASAFRQQSRACHPDKNEGANSDKFQALVAAYQLIQRSMATGQTTQSNKTT